MRLFFPAERVFAATDRIADELGDGGLDRGGGQSKAEAENRPNQLIDTECFCTNRAGEEYSIEEADDSAEDTGGGHQESTGDQGIFFDGR